MHDKSDRSGPHGSVPDGRQRCESDLAAFVGDARRDCPFAAALAFFKGTAASLSGSGNVVVCGDLPAVP